SPEFGIIVSPPNPPDNNANLLLCQVLGLSNDIFGKWLGISPVDPIPNPAAL
ncbi:MAG: hypothetical protein HQ528_04195, partial [Candidatus Marinimicrobia bacterium]|nr:hypothetical protein [Candidatus Neomarinimicrobiota bacterium]